MIASVWNLKISSFSLKPFHEKGLVTKYLQDNNETLYVKLKKFYFPYHFSWEGLSHELLMKLPLNQFLKKNAKMHFEQKLKTQKYKISFKNK